MSQAEQTGETQNLTLVQAVRDAMHNELARDEDVLVMGEDVGKNGGVFRATEGLYDEFGEERVIDTPLAESGIVGTAIGMAAYGLRPVAEIRAPYGGGIRAPEHHSESTETFFTHMPGLKVVMPSTTYDAKGLLISAIRDPDPVIFLEPKKIYRAFRQDVPDDGYTVPLGEATTRREGSDISVYCWGAMTRPTLAAAENLAGEIDVEVVDLRTVSPMDKDAIVDSFEKTGRAAVVHEAPRTGGLAGEITAILQEESLLYQEAPIERITGFDIPFPLYALEDYYLPEAARIEDGIREAVEF